MSPSLKRRLRAGLLWSLGAAGVVGALWIGQTLRKELRGDPLAAYRNPVRGDLPEMVGLRLTNVRIRRWKGETLQADFQMRGVDVERNRQVFAMTGIHDGVYRGPVGEQGRTGEFRFAAAGGRFNGFSSLLELNGDVRVAGKEFELESQGLVYTERTRQLRLSRGVQGRALGGNVSAMNVSYDLAKEIFTTGPAMWKGKIPARFLAMAGGELPADFQRKVWDVKADFTTTKGNLSVLTRGTARDGEVIISAPKITIDNRTDNLVATGGVRYWSGGANFVADKATVVRREKRALLEGNVRMLVKTKADEAKGPVVEELPPYTALPPEKVKAGQALPDPKAADKVRSGKSVRDYPLVIVADKVDYIYAKGRRVANITGAPQARQELGDGAWRQVWTTTARYDQEKELLRLVGQKGGAEARLKNSIGDDLVADWFELSTAEGDDEYSGSAIRGVVTTSEDEVPKAGNKTGEKADGGKSGGGQADGKGGRKPPPR